jgi:hypothetical protein
VLYRYLGIRFVAKDRHGIERASSNVLDTIGQRFIQPDLQKGGSIDLCLGETHADIGLLANRQG